MVNKILKESADSRRVVQVSMDIEVPRDFSESDLRGWGSGNPGKPGKIYMAIMRALNKIGGDMAGDYIELVTDHTDTYEDNGYFDESLKESDNTPNREMIEDGANQLLSDLFEKLGVDPQAAGQFSRWDEVVDWIAKVVMQLRGIPFNYDESLKEARGSKKPKYWNTMFATKVIDAYKDGKLSLDNIDDWETEYNGGTKPSNLGTKDILTYHINTGSDPRNESLKESAPASEMTKFKYKIKDLVDELARDAYGYDPYENVLTDVFTDYSNGKLKVIATIEGAEHEGEVEVKDESDFSQYVKPIMKQIAESLDQYTGFISDEGKDFNKVIDLWLNLRDESVKEECDKSLKEADEVVKNYTIEYTHGDGDHNDVDIKATSFGNLMDKFWSGEYGNSDEIEILSVYDEDGIEYDVGTGEEIW